jgi:thymidylate synthase
MLHTRTRDAMSEERQYLELIKKILHDGNERIDRTGVGTLSIFGAMQRYSLQDGTLPIFTTKRVFTRGVIEELLWMVSGSTDAMILAKKGIHIWDGNGSRSFLDSVGFHRRRVGDLGPVYGFQWRHAGATYIDCEADYTGQGVDQLAAVIETLKTNPYDRRMVICAWSPGQLKEMVLPPCHCLMQFHVANGRLNCLLYQRSADVGLGMPFNVTSYSLLTHMIAHITHLEPGELVYTTGDTHIYRNHIEALKKQVEREPRPFPKLTFARTVPSIDEFTIDDFVITGYNPHPKIEMQMAV